MPDVTFINKWPRLKCTRCGRPLMQGERGHAAMEFRNRPHTPLWDDGCYATEIEEHARVEGENPT